MEDCFVVVSMTIQNADNDFISAIKSVCKLYPAVKVSIKKSIADELKADKAEYTRKFKSSFEFLFLGWLFVPSLQSNSRFSGLRTHFVLLSFLRSASELASPELTILATVCKSNIRN